MGRWLDSKLTRQFCKQDGGTLCVGTAATAFCRMARKSRKHSGEKFTGREKTCASLLGAFGTLRKANISFAMNVRLYSWKQIGSRRTDFHEISYFGIFFFFFFENLSRTFKFDKNLSIITGTLYKDRYMYFYDNISPNSS